VYKDRTFLAIIPARGGSKRLPKKNLLSLSGKPLISYTIDAAKKVNSIDKIIVTSDNIEILEISKKAKIEVIQRPVELANDSSTTFDVVRHTIENLKKTYDYIILLQPTSPLRDETHINEAIKLLETKKADAIISVCKIDHSPLWSNTLDKNLSMNSFLKDGILNKRSQELEEYYSLNGAIYICKTEKLLEKKSFFLEKKIFAYKMDKKSSIDIDTKLDFLIAQTILENY